MKSRLKPRLASARRSALVSAAAEALEGRRLFAYTYAVIDLTPGDDHGGHAYGVSNNGKVALEYDGHAAVWQNGTLTDLHIPGYATDVNDSGVVCGVDTSGDVAVPFVYANGHETIIPTGGDSGSANAINAAGTVVGTLGDTEAGEGVGFVARLGHTPTRLSTPSGYTALDATGINDGGQIIGNLTNADDDKRAFLLTGSTYKIIPAVTHVRNGTRTETHHGLTNAGTFAFSADSPEIYDDQFTYDHLYTAGSSGTPSDKGRLADDEVIYYVANDLNAAGRIAFTYNSITDSDFSAGIYDGHTARDLTSLTDPAAGWALTSADAINDSGLIVGAGYVDNATDAHAYLAVPVPPGGLSISGTVFNDTNKNGHFDSGETNSGVRAVFIDANGNGTLDQGEIAVQSKTDGTYKFSSLLPGTYKIARVFSPGYTLSTGGTSVSVTVNTSVVTGINLGSARGTPATASISGTLWNDTDRDGVFDAGESDSGARTVFIDANGNKRLDPGERSVRSDAHGRYTFTGLAAGTYRVTRVFPSGYKLSNNSTGYLTITVGTAQAKTGVNLGSRTV